jgi:hypothetical protein
VPIRSETNGLKNLQIIINTLRSETSRSYARLTSGERVREIVSRIIGMLCLGCGSLVYIEVALRLGLIIIAKNQLDEQKNKCRRE